MGESKQLNMLNDANLFYFISHVVINVFCPPHANATVESYQRVFCTSIVGLIVGLNYSLN